MTCRIDHFPGRSAVSVWRSDNPSRARPRPDSVARSTSSGFLEPTRSRTAAVYARACSTEPEAGLVNTDIGSLNINGNVGRLAPVGRQSPESRPDAGPIQGAVRFSL